MAKTYLNEENMRDIIWGATLMGGGGGGSISSGMMLLDSYKKDHPDETLSVEMIDAGDMPKGTYAAATAGMGALLPSLVWTSPHGPPTPLQSCVIWLPATERSSAITTPWSWEDFPRSFPCCCL